MSVAFPLLGGSISFLPVSECSPEYWARGPDRRIESFSRSIESLPTLGFAHLPKFHLFLLLVLPIIVIL